MHVDEWLAVTSWPDLMAELKRVEQEISRLRGTQMRLLRELSRRSLPGDGPSASRLAAELDVSNETARTLLATADRTPEASNRMARLEAGVWSYDRAAAVARLAAAGADEETIESADGRDIDGVHRLRAMTQRIRRRDERQAHEERFVRAHASLDRSVGFIHAQLPAYDWHIVNRALEDRADRFPSDARAMTTRDQRRADALVAIAQHWLDGGAGAERAPGPIITVMVDAEVAAATACEAGTAITAGPRIGPETLDRMMCEGSVEIVIDPGSGVPLAVGPTSDVVPPKVRRTVLNRDGACTISGCSNTYRLEVHHIVPRSRNGQHELENLTTLCWWHHQVAVHSHGNRIDPASPPQRRRLIADRPP